MKKFTFSVKEGVYCSWCICMIRKTLLAKFAVKKMKADVLNSRVEMIVPNNVKSMSIIDYLDKRGYHLKEAK